MTKLFIFKQPNRNNWQDIITNLNHQLHNHHTKQFKYDFQIEIKKVSKKPSDEQRGYYYGVVLPQIRAAAAEQGTHYKEYEDLDRDIREVMKESFSLYIEIDNKLTGFKETRPISLSNIKGDHEMTKKYIETVKYWAESYFNIEIPEPVYRVSFNNNN